MKKLSLGELDVLEKALTRTPIQMMDIPKSFEITHWPKMIAPATIKLGVREYLSLYFIQETGLLRLERKMHNIEVTIHKSGAFSFSFTGTFAPRRARSDDPNPYDRLRAFVLFHQFKKEICERLTDGILRDAEAHNEAVQYIEEAIETFLPYLVADQLNAWGDET